jgi:hypothetical protein
VPAALSPALPQPGGYIHEENNIHHDNPLDT